MGSKLQRGGPCVPAVVQQRWVAVNHWGRVSGWVYQCLAGIYGSMFLLSLSAGEAVQAGWLKLPRSAAPFQHEQMVLYGKQPQLAECFAIKMDGMANSKH